RTQRNQLEFRISVNESLRIRILVGYSQRPLRLCVSHSPQPITHSVRMMNTIRQIVSCIVLMLIMAAATNGAEKYTLHSFKKTQLTDKFFSEGANFGDFNHDGVMDIVSE